ncbi:MAG: radical SAM family heme chaperone HemW [Xenococcaceae cyanobacterium MO_188.B32]|nr:radical SAM family heme chaperone HemW [Xenococcaceae cyanobacterium MO_188.B32]
MRPNLLLSKPNLSLSKQTNILFNTIPLAAYIHIPFCRRRCYYCDFPISVLGNSVSTSTSIMVTDYVDRLCQEIETVKLLASKLNTVFFGGGTPSLLPPALLAKILQQVEAKFGIATDAEISMEIDPGTFNRTQLQDYLAVGVNRFSLGVQAFQAELLQTCGRSHSLEDIFSAIELFRQANIANFSLDLISGLPQQTISQWQDSLARAIEIAPQHISGYDLVLEPVTAFGKQYQPGIKPLPTDEDTAAMYRLAQQMLTEAGYEHYEVSNYAKPGYQCRHNRVYWLNKAYYGFGMGAASYVEGKRFTRPRTRREYYAWVEAGAIIDVPRISETDYILETLMLGLRLAEGISLSQFEREIKAKIRTCLQPYRDRGWVEFLEIDGEERLRLNDPEGFLFSNTILATLFERLDS